MNRTQLARSRPHPWGLLALFLVVSCGEYEISALERLPPPASPDRGRVQVRDGNLLTDKGTRLRGSTFGVDARPDFAFDQALFDEMATEAGLNAFHVYLESRSDETGVNVAQADLLVELTSKAGLYLVLGIGGGTAGGTFDIEKIRSFWNFYGNRYASRTHVIFEIQNIPEHTCDAPYQPETLAMEREIYAAIRAVAPDTHVALFSHVGIPTPSALAGSLDEVDGEVDWSKTSVAFHSEARCVEVDALGSTLEVTRERNIAAFISEVSQGELALSGTFEANRVGWFNFRFVVFERDFEIFRREHEDAGVTWCPDFGVWPEDSSSCRAP